MKRLALVLIAIAAGCLLPAQPKAGDPTPVPTGKRGTVCWPLHFAGITLLVNHDLQVQRLLGHGVFRNDEGHTGGRYFVDAKRTATLHIIEGVDSVAEEIIVQSGIARELKLGEVSSAESKWFNAQEGFGNWGALRLGSTTDDVLKNLGQPKKKLTPTKWEYETVCACELPETLTITFKSGRVWQLALSAEE